MYFLLLEVPLDVMKESDIGASELVECRRGEVEVVLSAPFAAVDDRDRNRFTVVYVNGSV